MQSLHMLGIAMCAFQWLHLELSLRQRPFVGRDACFCWRLKQCPAVCALKSSTSGNARTHPEPPAYQLQQPTHNLQQRQHRDHALGSLLVLDHRWSIRLVSVVCDASALTNLAALAPAILRSAALELRVPDATLQPQRLS